MLFRSENNTLTFTRNEVAADEWNRTSKIGFAKPDTWNITIPFGNADNPHAAFMQNFVDAVFDGSPLNCPGEEGIGSIELANVMLYSSLLGQTIELPMDSAAYEKQLAKLIAESRFEKKVVEVSSEDFSASFRR